MDFFFGDSKSSKEPTPVDDDAGPPPALPAAAELLARVRTCAQNAQEAVSTDMKGYCHLAKRQYEGVTMEMERLCTAVEDETIRRALSNYVSLYRMRIAELTPNAAASNEEDSGEGFREPTFPVLFRESPMCYQMCAEYPPSSAATRPFWFLRNIVQTMVEGGHLGPTLYIPRDVWYQKHLRVFAAPAKISFCKSLTELLKPLQSIQVGKYSSRDVIKRLTELLDHLESLQNSMSKSIGLPSASEKNDGKGNEILKMSNLKEKFWKIKHQITKQAQKIGIASKDKGENDDRMYVPWLMNAINSSKIVEDLINFYQARPDATAIMSLLNRVSLFYQNVLCAYVLKDLHTLVERYLRKSRESFSRLLRT